MLVYQSVRSTALALACWPCLATPSQADEVSRFVPERTFIAQSVVVPSGDETFSISLPIGIRPALLGKALRWGAEA